MPGLPGATGRDFLAHKRCMNVGPDLSTHNLGAVWVCIGPCVSRALQQGGGGTLCNVRGGLLKTPWSL